MPRISPLRIQNPTPFIERDYRSAAAYQWAREALVNALEADATRVHFGVDWQAVASLGVYRRTVIDNGRGMSMDELREYFLTLGHGAKPIGGVLENFGIGARISLLPWNPDGVVVISRQDGQDTMIQIIRDPDSGGYGLREFELEGGEDVDTVVEPWEDSEHGTDWSRILPDWVGEHGTALVLLGAGADTMEGDQGKGESQRGLPEYLADRFWDLAGARVSVEEFSGERSRWPTQPRSYDLLRKAWQRRTVKGRRELIEDLALDAAGTVELDDGTRAHWTLTEPGASPARREPLIGVLYRSELYHVSRTAQRYRQFGVVPGAVRERLYIVLEPPVADDDGTFGAAPSSERSGLVMLTDRGRVDLPWDAWSDEWNRLLPKAIADAIASAQASREAVDLTDPRYRKLLDAFMRRMSAPVLRAAPAGETTMSESERVVTLPDGDRERNRDRQPQDREAASPAARTPRGPRAARESLTRSGLPRFRWVSAEDLGEDARFLAVWNEHGNEVLLNEDDDVYLDMVTYHQGQYPPHAGTVVRETVRLVFGAQTVLKVAHVRKLRRRVGAAAAREMLTPAALTTGLLGLQAEDSLIKAQLRGRLSGMRKLARVR